ncbi:MAG: hypothetical protein Kow0031_11920 [Anaerolineae bacterium]
MANPWLERPVNGTLCRPAPGRITQFTGDRAKALSPFNLPTPGPYGTAGAIDHSPGWHFHTGPVHIRFDNRQAWSIRCRKEAKKKAAMWSVDMAASGVRSPLPDQPASAGA